MMKRLAPLLLAFLLAASPARAEGQAAPERVVSINVCTDQLAMMIAAEGQLHSVSHLAFDPATSTMTQQARGLVSNHGLAEEIFLMKPDLVLAGTYTAKTTVALLRRLGFAVEEFPPARSFDEIRASITRIGALLHREARAAELLAEFDRGLAELEAQPPLGLTAISYSSNSWVTGAGSLSDEVMKAAGLRNMAAELGIAGGARLPLETLVASHPDLVVPGTTSYARPALAQENFVHPAFEALRAKSGVVNVPDRLWICGAPFTLDAARLLRDAAISRNSGKQ